MKSLISIVILTTLSLTSNATSICKHAFKVGWEPYPPFQIDGPQKPRGIDIDLVSETLKRAGCEVQFIHLPWARQLKELQLGGIDMVTSANLTTDREKFATFHSPYMHGGNVMFMLKKDEKKYKFTTLNDVVDANYYVDKRYFIDFNLGVVRDYEYGERYANLMKNAQFSGMIKITSSEEQLIKMSQAEKISAFLGDMTVFYYMLHQRKIDQDYIISNTKVDDISDLYFAFSKLSVPKDTSLSIDKTLKEVSDDGSFKTILLKYVPEEEINKIMIK